MPTTLIFEKSVLSNGLRLLTIPMPQVKSVTVLVMVAAGSRYEEPPDNGIFHFLEHTVLDGSQKWPTSLDLATAMDSVGASHNAFTGKEYTGFYVKAAAKHLELAMDVLSDVLLRPLLKDEDVAKEKAIITEEINMYEDQPQARVGELFEEELYGDSPLAKRISGEKATIWTFDAARLQQCLARYYHSGSLVLAVSGAYDRQQVNSLAEKFFGVLGKREKNVFAPVGEKQTLAASLVREKKTDQAHLCLGVRGYSLSHPDRFVLNVLNSILGGNSSSRLFDQIREKRALAYYVFSAGEEFLDCGYLVAQAGLKLEAVEEAIKVMLEQFALLRDKPVSRGELTKAKDFAQGRFILALEDSYRVASYYATQEALEDRVLTPEEMLAKIDAVTADDLLRVARDIFRTERLNLAVIGPFSDESKFARLLKL